MLVNTYVVYNNNYDLENQYYEFFVEKYNFIIRINHKYKLIHVKNRSNSYNVYHLHSYKHLGHLKSEKSTVQEIDINDNLIELCNKFKDDCHNKILIDEINKLFLQTNYIQNIIATYKIINGAKRYITTEPLKAIELFNNALDLSLNINIRGQILYNISFCYQLLNDTKNAINFLEESINNDYYDWQLIISLVMKIYTFVEPTLLVRKNKIKDFLQTIYRKTNSSYLLDEIQKLERFRTI